MLAWYTESHMEPRYTPGERMMQASPLKGATEATSKESKEKKTISASSSELLAAAAIKDIKRPEGLPETPKNEPLLNPEKTWLGPKDAAETSSNDLGETQDNKNAYTNDIEHLTPGEARSVVNEYVEHRLPIIQQERTEVADNVEELAAIDANEAFLTQMRAEIADEETTDASPEDLIDQAMQDVINELGLGDTVAAREPEAAETSNVFPQDGDEGTLNAAQMAHITDEISTHGHDLPDEDASNVAPDGAGSGEPPHNGHNEPPYSGDTPEGPRNSEPFVGGAAVGPDTEPTREINPLPPAPNDRLERVKRDTERQHDMLKGMLVGGVIGYVIGRRRGRIKTEQKLKPVQEKLQQEADALRRTVAGHEQTIRSLAREKTASEEQARIREARMTAVIRSREPAKQPEPMPSQTLVKTPEQARADVITNILAVPAKPAERAPATHAEVARQKVAQQAVERTPGAAVDVVAVPPATRRLERVATPKTVESMPLPALIKASESVVVGGKTLKSYFESGRIGEHGMRRVLSEHLRTGKTEQALNVELFSHERRKKRSMEFLPAHAGDDNDEKLLSAGAMPPSSATSRHTPQSALVADDSGSRVVPPVKRKDKDGRAVSAMVVVICIILLAGVLFLVLR